MSAIHYIGSGGPACGAADARWCSALAQAVTCPACRRLLVAAGVPVAPFREDLEEPAEPYPASEPHGAGQ